MFPFGDNPPLHHQPSLKKPPFQLYDQIQNPVISKHDDPPFFSNFPSPFFDEHELPLNQIFPSFYPKPANPTPPPSSEHPTTKDHPPRRRSLSAAAPRKRTGKKDRHSKIRTAQGIRDRRMRLSLQIARKFFDLQDMLGYDKASKTIEWLFTKSKKAIKELAKDVGVRGENDNNVTLSDGKSESFISECEVVSGIEESCEVKEGLLMVEEDEDDGDGSFEKTTKPRKQAACKPNTRESREKARARARCRTEEKMMGKRKSSPNRGNDLEKVGSSTIDPNFDVGDRERVSAAYAAAAGDYSPLLHPPPPPPSDVGTIEKLLGSSSADYSCSAAAAAAVSCCIDPTTTFMGFLGNWDLLSNDRLNYSNIQASTMAGNPTSIYSDFPLFHQ